MNAIPDFSVLRHFRSVTLLSDASQEGIARLVDIDLFLDWLARYDHWYKATVLGGDQLSLMYNRSLSLTAPRLDEDLPHLIRIATAARDLGFGPIAQVDISECLDHPEALFQLLDDGRLNTLFLDASQIDGVDLEACAALVRKLAATGVALILYGPTEFWTATGVLTAPELNRVSFQLLPLRRRPDASAAPAVPRKGLKLLPPDSKSLIAPHVFNPCAHRFQLLVAPDGVIYPCHALIGLVPLAHIAEPVGPEMFEGTLDWNALGQCGPALSPENDDREIGNEALPLVCRSHIRTLQMMSETPPL